MDFNRYENRAGLQALRRLSQKAGDLYVTMDPLDVYERNGLYYLRGVLEADELTFEELDKLLCDIADALG